jgi:MoaA/NifB/PqqE/SkfB family radical SAM enzyme
MPRTRGLWSADDDTDLRDLSGRVPPKKLMFSLNGKCNLRCDHCPRGVYDIRAEQTPVKVIDYVMEHVLPGVRCVRLGGTDLGEQLTSPHFNRFLRRVEELGSIRLEVVSNLTVMDEERAELLARACHEFSFSIEGVGPAYERTRHFPWSKIERNLDLVVAARRRARDSKLKIFPLVTCFYDNLRDLLPILDLVDRGVDHIAFRLFNPVTPEQSTQSLVCHATEANEVFAEIRREAARRNIQAWLPPDLPATGRAAPRTKPLSATTFRHQSPIYRTQMRRLVSAYHGTRQSIGRAIRRGLGLVQRSAESREPGAVTLEPAPVQPTPSEPAPWTCHFPFETVSITSDRRVGTCCGDIRLGTLDVEKPNLEAIWTGAEWYGLRQSMVAGRWEGACAECDFRRTRMREMGLM